MRPSATIVIPAWNGWELTLGCLSSLEPTLGLQDQVVVVDNGSADATPEVLADLPWVTAITNPTNLGFARACNQGAAVATGDVIVFLNNDTVLAPGWLERLCTPFAGSDVGAAGPRSNFVSGPQMVDGIAYDLADRAGHERWVDAWALANLGRTEDVQRLVGFCLAVRRCAFESIDGFDEGFGLGGFEDDDLCCRLSDAGWRLVIAHEAFVHHIGHQTFDANGVDWRALETENGVRFLRKRRAGIPLLAAAVRAAGDARGLEGTLARLADRVEETVVYGTSPAAAARAESLGVPVVAGSEEVFGATRASWILWMDADEMLDGDLDALRTLLEGRAVPAQIRIAVRELRAEGNVWRDGLMHYAHRLTGRPALPSPGAPAAALCEISLTHLDGELCAVTSAGERVLAQARTIIDLGWPEFAVPYLDPTSVDATQGYEGTWWRSLVADVILTGGAGPAAEMLGRAATHEHLLRAMALARTGADDQALVQLSVCADDPAAVVERWRIHDRAGDEAAAAAALTGLASDERLVPAIEHACRIEADAAWRLLEQLWARHPGLDVVLAGGSRLRLAAGLEEALVWAHRLRAHGLPSACPLLLAAATPTTPPLERVRAAAVAWAAFGEQVSRQLAQRAWPELGTAELGVAQAFVEAIAPALLDDLVGGEADGRSPRGALVS